MTQPVYGYCACCNTRVRVDTEFGVPPGPDLCSQECFDEYNTRESRKTPARAAPPPSNPMAKPYRITYYCGAFTRKPPRDWELLDEGHPDLPPVCEHADVIEVAPDRWRAGRVSVKCGGCGRSISFKELAALDVNSDEQLANDE